MSSPMLVFRTLPVVISFLVLGAHFLRAELVVLATVCVIFPGLLLVPRAWSARALQLGLALGTLEWMRTLSQLVELRVQSGESWTRMAVILGGVALFTALSALIFQGRAMTRRYRLGREF